MAELRQLILENSTAWRKARRAFEAQRSFVLEPERYKRSKYPESSAAEREWLDLKSACLTHCEDGLELLFSPALPGRLAEDYKSIAPVYELFMEASARAHAQK